MIKLKPLQILLFAVLGTGSAAQAADLMDTFREAQANDPVFASARAAQQAGQEKLTQGRSLLMPSVNLSANSTFNDIDVKYRPENPPQLSNVATRYNSSGVGVTVVQPLFRQQNWQVYTESELQTAQSDAQFKIAEQDLILRVAQAYFDVLIAQDSLQLVQAQKNAISEQLDQAKRNFEVGSATITDTLEAQARYDLTSAQEIASQNNLEIKRRALQQLTNGMSQDLQPLGEELKLETP